MRIALVGWESDDSVAGALAQLGVEVVALTRWFPGLEVRENFGGWTKLRCPHQIEATREAEAESFRDAALHQVSALGLDANFDVVHALDVFAQPAAVGLRERSSSAALIGSIGQDIGVDLAVLDRSFRPDRWICDHPWVADRCRGGAVAGSSVAVIARQSSLTIPSEEGYPASEPQLVLWLSREAAVDPDGIVSAIAHVREEEPTLAAVVLGEGPIAQAVRSRLASRGWLVPDAVGVHVSTFEHWQHQMTHGAVVGVVSEQPATDPAAHIAWNAGVPVVRIDSRDPKALADAIRDALRNPRRREADVKAGAVLAESAVEPPSVARAWLAVYLDAILARGVGAAESRPDEPMAVPLQPTCSRLAVTALSPRELYASWFIRPGDWHTAVEWLGEDAARATLVLRVLDVTDIRFHGANAHGHRDVELGPHERHRVIGLDAPGRSFAASLGVLSRRGYFQAIAHARLCHLPRESLAPPGHPERRIAVHRR